MIRVLCFTPLRCDFGSENWSWGGDDEGSHGRVDCVVQGCRPEVDRTQAQGVQAQVTLDYLDGSIWKAERVFGWSHHTVALGLNELRTGITCQGNFSARGNHKTETKSPELEADIRIRGSPRGAIPWATRPGTQRRRDDRPRHPATSPGFKRRLLRTARTRG